MEPRLVDYDDWSAKIQTGTDVDIFRNCKVQLNEYQCFNGYVYRYPLSAVESVRRNYNGGDVGYLQECSAVYDIEVVSTKDASINMVFNGCSFDFTASELKDAFTAENPLLVCCMCYSTDILRVRVKHEPDVVDDVIVKWKQLIFPMEKIRELKYSAVHRDHGRFSFLYRTGLIACTRGM